ncbi:universal stress protein [Oerskovia turbata]
MSTVGPVVVGYDGSPSATSAVRWAAREAARREARLDVVFVRDAHDTHLDPTPRWTEDAQSGARDLVERGRDVALEVVPDVEVETSVEHTTPAATLVGTSLDASVVVVGSGDHGRVRGELGGSVALAVAAHAHCPVVVVHGDVEALRDVSLPVVVGVDGSTHATGALRHAAEVAVSRGASLRVVVAWWTRASAHLESYAAAEFPRERAEGGAERLLAAAMGQVREEFPDLDVEGATVEAQPAPALVRASEGAERLVVGSRGRGGFAALVLGSVSHALVREAHCPVVIVR